MTIDTLYVSTALILIPPVFVLYVLLSYFSPNPRRSLPEEETFISLASPKYLPLPSTIKDSSSLELSVIVPAYNESKRLPAMMKEALEHLREKYEKGSWEIVVVDDGSKDNTVEVALEIAKKEREENIRIVKLSKNRGKGGAVTHGMLHARGKRMLFVDADGASKFSDLQLLQDEMDRISIGDGYAVVVGSRAHLVKSEAVVKRSFIRNLLMRGFHLYLSLLGLRSIRDTQCGFKLFSRPSAALLFPLMHAERWIFDCEILLLAEMANIPIGEVFIEWKEIEGSKVDLIKDSINMALDLLMIRANYILGRWKKPKKVQAINRHVNGNASEKEKAQ